MNLGIFLDSLWLEGKGFPADLATWADDCIPAAGKLSYEEQEVLTGYVIETENRAVKDTLASKLDHNNLLIDLLVKYLKNGYPADEIMIQQLKSVFDEMKYEAIKFAYPLAERLLAIHTDNSIAGAYPND